MFTPSLIKRGIFVLPWIAVVPMVWMVDTKYPEKKSPEI
jgi:hypothetical protein